MALQMGAGAFRLASRYSSRKMSDPYLIWSLMSAPASSTGGGDAVAEKTARRRVWVRGESGGPADEGAESTLLSISQGGPGWRGLRRRGIAATAAGAACRRGGGGGDYSRGAAAILSIRSHHVGTLRRRAARVDEILPYWEAQLERPDCPVGCGVAAAMVMLVMLVVSLLSLLLSDVLTVLPLWPRPAHRLRVSWAVLHLCD